MMRKKNHIVLLIVLLALVFGAGTVLASVVINTGPTTVADGAGGVDVQGTATFDGGTSTMCIRLDSGHNTGTPVETACDVSPPHNGSGPFSCNIPASEIGVSTINYTLVAWTADSGCTGSSVETVQYQFDPTAISLVDFSADSEGANLWPVALGLLALLGVAVYIVRRVAVYNT